MRILTIASLVVMGITMSMFVGNGVASAGPAVDANGKKVHVPNPQKTLKKITQQLGASTNKSSFHLLADIKVGTSTESSHEITKMSYMALFDVDVARGVMRVEDPDAYRSQKGGAIRTHGEMDWRHTGSTKGGTLMQHFLEFPSALLKKVQKNPKRIQWIWIGDELEEETTEEEDTTEEGEGHTVVVKRKNTEEKNAKVGMPHVIRIDLAKKVAGNQWFEVVQSRLFEDGGWGVSTFLSRVDGTVSDGYMLINLSKDHKTPISFELVFNTGIRDAAAPGEDAAKTAVREHVTVHYNYTLDGWGQVERFVIPADAAKLLK